MPGHGTRENLLKNPTNRPQRNFVVEYKSNRKQPRETAKSIWGNTDLRALSEAVADHMPATKEAVQPSETPPKIETAAMPQPNPVLKDAPSLAATLEDCPVAEPIAPAIEATEIVTAEEMAPEQKKVRKQRRARTTKTPAQPAQKGPVAMSASPISFDDRDILSVLELENRRLKGLLVEKLRRENDELAAMLRRFEG
jgi:hypothetical protein